MASKKSKGNFNKSFLNSTSSKNRNQDFIEYVVGADTLLPKRIKSRKSDLPYSQGSHASRSNSRQRSHDARDIFDLQK